MSLLIPILIVAGGLIGNGLAGSFGAGIGVLVGTVLAILIDQWASPTPRRPWH